MDDFVCFLRLEEFSFIHTDNLSFKDEAKAHSVTSNTPFPDFSFLDNLYTKI